MKMKMLALVLFFITTTICCKRYKEKTLIETLESDCFWDNVNDKEAISGLNSCFRFLPNGKCYFYYYHFYNRVRTDSVNRYSHDDGINEDTWSTIGDSILFVQGIKYRLVYFSEDSVVIQHKRGDSVFLRKNCQTFIGR